MKIAVIGAGVAGMAVAVRMAVRGYKVDVYEANSYAGGKLTAIELDSYRFDAGPSVFTMPQYFEELFALAGKSFQEYCPYIKLDLLAKYFFEDDTEINAYADKNQFSDELENKLNISPAATLKHLNKSAVIYNETKDIFLNKSLHTLKQHNLVDLITSSKILGKINLFSSMHSVNNKRFKNEKATQIFDRYATYNGSNPYSAPATLNVIPHLEHNIGGFFPLNGMHALTQSLVKLGEELGVNYHFNAEVDEIVVKNNIAIGVKVNQKEIGYDQVISGSDVVHTYRKLLKNHKAPERILNQEKSASAIVFYWGIKKEFRNLTLHNVLFSKNYKAEFDAIFGKNYPYKDPTVYINITSKHQIKDAPKGCENWFVMINAPHQKGQKWESIIKQSRKNIIDKINKTLKTDIEPLIEVEDILEPRLIASRTRSYLGALYGNASNSKWAPFLRHSNFSKKIKHLYFCGGSVHPGGGIPICMLSAKIVDELMHS